MRTRDSALRKNSPLYGPERFTYLPESNSTSVPQASNSTTADTMLGTVPTSISGPANVVGRAHKNAMHHLAVEVSLRSTCMSLPATREDLAKHA